MTDNQQQSNESENGDRHQHPKPRYEDVNVPVIVMITIFSAVMTFVSIAFVQGIYYRWEQHRTQASWYDREPTPQEVTIRDQVELRDSFFETKDGKIYTSVDVAAQKLIDAKGDLTKFGVAPMGTDDPPENDPPKKADPEKTEPKKTEPEKADLPEPPGPDDQPEKKSEPKKESEPSKG